jgi:hypothetical protein
MNSEFRDLMEEPPGGEKHGRRAHDAPHDHGARWLPLGVEESQAREFARLGGFGPVVTTSGSTRRGRYAAYGARDVGMTASRGVLHPDEYVDHEALVAAVEAELGFSFDDVHAVYRQGPLSTSQRELRAAIDARLLALSRSGANLVLLGTVLGFPTKPDEHGGSCRVVTNAIRRARDAESTSTEGSH